MNERGVDVLVRAALQGRKQVRRVYHHLIEGNCAIGELHEAIPGHHRLCERISGTLCCSIPATVTEVYQLRLGEVQEIVNANDFLGWDFLTIARKFGASDATL